MAKFGLITIISVVLNLFLSFWLINQYMSDVYFQAYVNGTIGQYYPFIVLTLGVGGGSGLGYLFLKRKHGDTSLVSKIQKSKSFKTSGPLVASSASVSKQSLPTGAPPALSSKHTAYAVPPLPKTATLSSSRAPAGSAWAAAGSTKSSLESILSPKQDNVLKPSGNVQTQRTEMPKPSAPSFTPFSENQSPQPLRSIGESPTKQSSWAPQPPSSERRPEQGPIFQKPGIDLGVKPEQSYSGFSGQPTGPSTSPVPSKWSPPEDKTGSAQWPDGGVRSIPPLPTKWTPPSSSNQEKVPPPQAFPRPSSGPTGFPAQRPPPPQGGSRPFVIQGPGGGNRPGEQRPIGPPRPIAAPQPFRPDPNRPPFGPPGQPRPQSAPRPAAPLAGPMPQPWTPPLSVERKDYSSIGLGNNPSQTPTGADSPQAKPGLEPKAPTESSAGGGEMDWDTALDTILKTLRKDRVGDTK